MNLVKGGIAFTAGAAVGAGIVYFVMNKKVKDANEATQVAVDMVKASKNEEIKELTQKLINKETSSIDIRIPEENLETEENPYHEAVESIKNLEDDIAVVPASEFEVSEDTRVYLTYYKLDDMVMFSDSMIPMDYPENYLGDSFRELFDDSDVVYIRNDKEGEIYEVLLDAVNSLGEEDDLEETHNVFDDSDNEGGPIAEGGE